MSAPSARPDWSGVDLQDSEETAGAGRGDRGRQPRRVTITRMPGLVKMQAARRAGDPPGDRRAADGPGMGDPRVPDAHRVLFRQHRRVGRRPDRHQVGALRRTRGQGQAVHARALPAAHPRPRLDPTYVKPEDVYPYTRYEGIKIHDWDEWEDPFRLTVDSYCKYQAEKDKKLYAVIDGFAQGQGHLSLTDARYVNSLKLFIQGVTPLEYAAHRHFAYLARHLDGAGRAVRGAAARASTSCATPRPRSTRSASTTSTTAACTTSVADARPGLVPQRAEVVLRRRHVGGPVRVPHRHLVQLRVPADQPAVRAVHERGELQRRPGDDDVRLLGAERREPAHDARASSRSSSCSSRTRATSRSSRTGSTSGSGAATGCSAWSRR